MRDQKEGGGESAVERRKQRSQGIEAAGRGADDYDVVPIHRLLAAVDVPDNRGRMRGKTVDDAADPAALDEGVRNGRHRVESDG